MEQTKESGTKSRGYCVALQQGTGEWLEARKDFDLNASELGAAIGLARFRSRLDLYEAKVLGQLMPSEDDVSARQKAIEHGRLYEPDAACYFQQHCRQLVVRDRKQASGVRVKETGIWPLACGSFTLSASPDRLLSLEDQGIVATYKAKCRWSGRLFKSAPRRVPCAGPDAGGGCSPKASCTAGLGKGRCVFKSPEMMSCGDGSSGELKDS